MTLRPLPVLAALALMMTPFAVVAPAQSQTPAAPAPARAPPAPAASDVVVLAPDYPKVVSSYPAEGAAVA